MTSGLHNKSLDGLRGLAALNVVISHFVIAFFPSLLSRNYPDMFDPDHSPGPFYSIVQSPPVSLFYNGLFPVILFFVLSGYVLARPYYFNDHMALKKRFIGRYLRLNIPIAASLVLAYILLRLNAYSNLEFAQIMGPENRMKNYFGDDPGIVFTSLSALYDSIVFGESTLNPPLWSLRVEFIGTMLLLLVYLFNPKGMVPILFVLLTILIYKIAPGDSIFYVAIFTGALLHKISVNRGMSWLLFFVGLYLGAYQHNNTWYSFLPQCRVGDFELWEIKAFYNTIGAICLTMAVLSGFGKRFFESILLQFLGRISFSIYLLHFIILCSVSCGLYLLLPRTYFYVGLNFFLYLGVSFGLSWLFYKYMDQPAIKISKTFSRWIMQWTGSRSNSNILPDK